jgi:opacity protein-like surface antigen
MFKVDYSYSFVRDSKWDLWGSFGFQVLDLDLSRQDPAAQADSSSVSQRTHLPVLGLGGEYNLSSNWNLKGGIRYFDGSIGDWGGNLLDAKLSLEYSAFDRMGIGLSYDLMTIGLDRNKADSQDYYGLHYDGVGIYARFTLD